MQYCWPFLVAIALLPGLSYAAERTVPADAAMAKQLKVPDKVIETGNAAPLIRYSRTIKGGAHTNASWSSGWQITHALAAWTGDERADAKLLEQIEYNLKGANSISANGGYPAQHELHVTGLYAILR